MSKILDNLYLGDSYNATDLSFLTSNNITHIVNCAEELSPAFPNRFTYLHIKAKDTADFQLCLYFDQATDFINKVIHESKGNVLVHCKFGVSRSATVVIAYLIRFEKMTCWKAKGYCQNLRNEVCPNDGFWKQLQDYFYKFQPNYLTQNKLTLDVNKAKSVPTKGAEGGDKKGVYTVEKKQIQVAYQKSDSWSPTTNDDLEEYKQSFDGSKPNDDTKLEYKCRMCKSTVFREWNIVKHASNHDNCLGYFIDNVHWMKTMDDKTMSVCCPNEKCNYLIGKIVLSGVKCTCGKWIKPANQIMKNNVEKNKAKS